MSSPHSNFQILFCVSLERLWSKKLQGVESSADWCFEKINIDKP